MALLADDKLHAKWWEEEIVTVKPLAYRVFHRGCDVTPYKERFNHHPDVSHIREFRCRVWENTRGEIRHKLQPGSKLEFLLGYRGDQSGNRILLEEKVTVSRDAFLDESSPSVAPAPAAPAAAQAAP